MTVAARPEARARGIVQFEYWNRVFEFHSRPGCTFALLCCIVTCRYRSILSPRSRIKCLTDYDFKIRSKF